MSLTMQLTLISATLLLLIFWTLFGICGSNLEAHPELVPTFDDYNDGADSYLDINNVTTTPAPVLFFGNDGIDMEEYLRRFPPESESVTEAITPTTTTTTTTTKSTQHHNHRHKHHNKPLRLPNVHNKQERKEIESIISEYLLQQGNTNLALMAFDLKFKKKIQDCPCHYKVLYCLNGGTCFRYIVDKGRKAYFCECPEGYGGERCENKYPSPINDEISYGNVSKASIYLDSIIIAGFIGIILVYISFILFYQKHHRFKFKENV